MFALVVLLPLLGRPPISHQRFVCRLGLPPARWVFVIPMGINYALTAVSLIAAGLEPLRSHVTSEIRESSNAFLCVAVCLGFFSFTPQVGLALRERPSTRASTGRGGPSQSTRLRGAGVEDAPPGPSVERPRAG
jgi:hypothetical protein